MKNLLLGIIAINLTFISFTTNAFEFNGVKSGMSREEVKAQGVPYSWGRMTMDEEDLESWLPNLRMVGDFAEFWFDDNDRLYRLQIKFRLSKYSPDYNEGVKEAYLEFCDLVLDATVADFLGNPENGLICRLQDEEIYRDSVDYQKQKRLQQLNQLGSKN